MNPETNRFEPISEVVVCSKCGHKNQPHYKKCLSCGTPQGAIAAFRSAVKEIESSLSHLIRADGSPVPDHWATFKQGEHVVLKNYTFKVGYIGDAVLVLEPVGPYVVGDVTDDRCIPCELSGHCERHG